MRDQAIQIGVPSEVIFVEPEALHTRENAEHVLCILGKHDMHRVILVTFAKVFQPQGIEIINHYVDTGEWHPAIWFLSAKHRKLVKSEIERIKKYREKGDLL